MQEEQDVKMTDPVLLRRIEDLIHKTMALAEKADDEAAHQSYEYAMKCLLALADAVLQGKDVFGIEPWHPVHEDVPLSAPGEMLLRVRDAQGAALAPYPAIMTFYQNNLTAEIDGVLFLYALSQFARSDERQVSINISARSLRNADFIKTILARRAALLLPPEKKVIIEIHESTPHLKMSAHLLKLLRSAGFAFAIDDVGLSMNDVLRLSDFENIADYIKLDRRSVQASPERPYSLDHVVAFITATLPNTVMVAEGVRSMEQARALHEFHPAIRYVQGLYLPDRSTFAAEWAAQTTKMI
jgi:EAL domain-containing protein (putative c-di-GMP-specific phosphodiesterase class I)